MRFLHSIAIAAFSVPFTVVAAPVEYYFTGLIDKYYHGENAESYSLDQSKIGQAFSGSYIIDTSLAESVVPGGAQSAAGCLGGFNSDVCESTDFGTGSMFITNFTVTIGQRNFSLPGTPFNQSVNLLSQDENSRTLYHDGATAEINSRVFLRSHLLFEIYAHGQNILPNRDFEAELNFANAESTYFWFISSEARCDDFDPQSRECAEPFRFTGAEWTGTITSWTLSKRNPSEISEPASLALVGLGVAGLAAIRRRKAHE